MSSYLKLDTIIDGKLDDLEFMDLNDDEREKMVDEIVKLEKLKLEVEAAEYERKRREENDILEEGKRKMAIIEKIVDYGFRLAGIVVPIVVYGHWMKESYKFEKDSTYSYQISRDNKRNAFSFLTKRI